MESKKIYADSLNGKTELDLRVVLNEDINPQYVLLNPLEDDKQHFLPIYEQYYVPIELKILDVIENAKAEIKDNRQKQKVLVEPTRTHIKRLKAIIRLSKETESFFHEVSIGIIKRGETIEKIDMLLETLKVSDGCSNERSIAIASYETQLRQAEKKLIEFEQNSKTLRKNILLECRKTISNLLKANGLIEYENSAEFLMEYNGLKIPQYLLF